MSCPQQRQTLMGYIHEAARTGARLASACAQVGLTARTLQRWKLPAAVQGDRRVKGRHQRPAPANKLSASECQVALALVNSEEFKNLPPSQIVPRLADQGRYIASESTLYRLLHQAGQMRHRGLARVPHKRAKPRALIATAPNQIYCWDITYLPTQVRGNYFYLYLYVDLFSRMIVGWQIYEKESAELAAQLLTDICSRHAIGPDQLVVHSDNGSPMKGETMLATMQRLGVAPSRSRPSVSNDNPFSESLFRTLKYRPELPVNPFADLRQARRWAEDLVSWYNDEHRHSAIGFVTPAQRHAGQDQSLLEARVKVYETAAADNPSRWSRNPRNWQRVTRVHLNPNTPKAKDCKPSKNLS